MSIPDRFTVITLRAAIAIPFFYYGIQLAIAPSYPDYSFIRNVASVLGSDRAANHAVFNGGLMALGITILFGAYGFLRALLRATHPVLAWLTALALAVVGVQTLWAGYFPMPDPRHGGHSAFIVAMILLPLLLTGALWKQSGRGLRVYLIATVLLLAVMFPLMSDLIPVDRASYDGLLQRVFTLTIFPPIGVAAYVLSRRVTGGGKPGLTAAAPA